MAEQLIGSGRVERGFLGVRGRALSELSRAERRALGTDRSRGIVVTFIRPSSPAAAVFRAGDVILEISGRQVETYDTLRARVARIKPGTDVVFVILRGGREQAIEATLTRRPANS